MYIELNSEFIAALAGALIGGGISYLTQRAQFRREDNKATSAKKLEDEVTAQTILFKLSSIFNSFANINNDILEARSRCGDGDELFTVYSPPVHSPSRVGLEYRELIFFAEKKQFEFLHSYQEASEWMGNLIQSLDAYRDLYLDFFLNQPADVKGQVGWIALQGDELRSAAPKIATLRSLCDSLESVVVTQTADLHALYLKYPDIMFEMVQKRPSITVKAPRQKPSTDLETDAQVPPPVNSQATAVNPMAAK